MLVGADDGEVDVEQAIDACHAAVRKAVTAHMNYSGVKIASGVEGRHAVTIEYGEQSIIEVPPDLWRSIKALRKARNDADYTNPTQYRLTKRDAEDAIEIAGAAVTLIGTAIKTAEEKAAAPDA